MTLHVGIIAEDKSDVDVIREFLLRRSAKQIAVRFFVGRGCGKIKNKSRAWAENLSAQGCTRLIIVHDSDGINPRQILGEIQKTLNPNPIKCHVISVPVREIEAWLLADQEAIKKALKLKGKVKKIANPESILNPKRALWDLVNKASGKSISYLNTVHNKQIASECSVQLLRRCPSFASLDGFIQQHIL